MAVGDIFTADFRTTPWWWEDCEWAEEPPADLPRFVDVLVVGGGYAGVHCALTLAESGRDVLVLDAERLGWGASTRNGVNAFDTGTMPTHPLYTGTPWFLPIIGTYYQARDWLDRRRDAPRSMRNRG